MSLLPSAQPSFVMTGDGFPFTEFLPGNLGFKAPFPPECTNYEGHGLFPLCLFLKDICNCQFSGPLAPTSSLSRSHPPPNSYRETLPRGWEQVYPSSQLLSGCLQTEEVKAMSRRQKQTYGPSFPPFCSSVSELQTPSPPPVAWAFLSSPYIV